MSKIFFSLMTSGVKSIDLRSNLIEKRYRGMKRAIQCFFRILPSYHTFGDNSECLRKTAIFSKFDLWWPLVTSILTWPGNDLYKSWRSRRSLSNAVCRMSLRCVVFDISGGAESAPPPRTELALKKPYRNRVKSMGKISTTSFSHQNISIHWEWCWLRSSVMTQATVFIGDPPKVIWGHLRSPTVFCE